MSDIAALVNKLNGDCDLEDHHLPELVVHAAGATFIYPKHKARSLLLVVSAKKLHFVATDEVDQFSRRGAVSNPEGVVDLLLWYAWEREWREDNLALGKATEALMPPNATEFVRMVLN